MSNDYTPPDFKSLDQLALENMEKDLRNAVFNAFEHVKNRLKSETYLQELNMKRNEFDRFDLVCRVMEARIMNGENPPNKSFNIRPRFYMHKVSVGCSEERLGVAVTYNPNYLPEK